jgi:aminobenzoyl-glutamate utilization protein B
VRTAARTLSGALLELFAAPELVAAARAEFGRQTAGKPYVCPIPADQQPPIGR